MLVLVDLFLHGQQLFLELVSKAGQCLSDVVGQLLVQDTLEVGGPHAVGNMAVRRVAEEEFTLGCDGLFDVLLAVDVLFWGTR